MFSTSVECNIPESRRNRLHYSHTSAWDLFPSLNRRSHDCKRMSNVCWNSVTYFRYKPKFLLVILGLSSVYTVSCKISDCKLNSYKDKRSQELTSEILHCFCVDRLGDIWKCKLIAYKEGNNLCTGLFRFRGFQDVEDHRYQGSRDVNVVRLSTLCNGRLCLFGNIARIYLLEAQSNPRP
jgi:hypothetical protein